MNDLHSVCKAIDTLRKARGKTTTKEAEELEDSLINWITLNVKDSTVQHKLHTEQYASRLAERRKLPISNDREEILKLYQVNPVIILSSDTATGKTTQVPQFIAFDGFGFDKTVAITQPRRLAVYSSSCHVAMEMDAEHGKDITGVNRFEKGRYFEASRHNRRPLIQYSTDGVLLRQAVSVFHNPGNKPFATYNCIIVDEAHERTLHSDVLMVFLKNILKQRNDLKVIIMSATLNAQVFRDYFPKAPLHETEGRRYDVKIHYRPVDHHLGVFGVACNLAKYVHETKEKLGQKGDILIFVSGKAVVDKVYKWLKEHTTGLMPLALYGKIPFNEQKLVFETFPGRKCVISTSIAETSLTIEGIATVIDLGLQKECLFDPKTRLERLRVVQISQASAQQRAGRAGRTQEGECYRLYSQEEYEKFEAFSKPPILTQRLTSHFLMIQSFTNNRISTVEWITDPYESFLQSAVDENFELSVYFCIFVHYLKAS
jgi:pre-mRNA-splicing factor ATP-dependent RNA helicase DHX15/PRP43